MEDCLFCREVGGIRVCVAPCFYGSVVDAGMVVDDSCHEDDMYISFMNNTNKLTKVTKEAKYTFVVCGGFDIYLLMTYPRKSLSSQRSIRIW